MRLVVGIATFNGSHLLEKTLPSLLGQTLRADRIVVVDDGSNDGTEQWLEDAWPEVVVIRHATNRGITASLNTCLRAGLDAEFVGLFNNDVELAPECLERMCAALDADRSAAACGPKMLNYYDRTMLDGAGDVYCWVGTAYRRGQYERDRGQYDIAQQVFGVCGGAAVYRSEAIRRVGLLDEDFYAYYEDVDWAFRVNLAGYRCLYEPSAVVYHMSSATTGGGFSRFSCYYSWRNSLWIVAKNWSRQEILRHAWLLALQQVANLALAVRKRLLVVLLRAWLDAARGTPAMLRKRADRPSEALSLELPRAVLWRPRR